MAKKSTSKVRPPARIAGRSQPQFEDSGSDSDLEGHGSGSFSESQPRSKFFSKDQLIPVLLTLKLDAPLEGGNESGRGQLNRPVVLIHAQDPSFVNCWFSRAIDLGDESANPGYWMLQKTATDAWLLSLRRVSGEAATYHLRSKIKSFPITLAKGQTTKDFQWPTSITVSHSG